MGMGIDDEGHITALKSGTAEPGRLANGGVYLVDPSVLRTRSWAAGGKLSLEDDMPAVAFGSGVAWYGFECAGAFIEHRSSGRLPAGGALLAA